MSLNLIRATTALCGGLMLAACGGAATSTDTFVEPDANIDTFVYPTINFATGGEMELVGLEQIVPVGDVDALNDSADVDTIIAAPLETQRITVNPDAGMALYTQDGRTVTLVRDDSFGSGSTALFVTPNIVGRATEIDTLPEGTSYTYTFVTPLTGEFVLSDLSLDYAATFAVGTAVAGGNTDQFAGGFGGIPTRVSDIPTGPNAGSAQLNGDLLLTGSGFGGTAPAQGVYEADATLTLDFATQTAGLQTTSVTDLTIDGAASRMLIDSYTISNIQITDSILSGGDVVVRHSGFDQLLGQRASRVEGILLGIDDSGSGPGEAFLTAISRGNAGAVSVIGLFD